MKYPKTTIRGKDRVDGFDLEILDCPFTELHGVKMIPEPALPWLTRRIRALRALGVTKARFRYAGPPARRSRTRGRTNGSN